MDPKDVDAPLVWEAHEWLTRRQLADIRIGACPAQEVLLDEILALRSFAESALAQLPDIAEDEDGCVADPDHPMSRLFAASWRLFQETKHPEWEVYRLNPGGETRSD